MTASARLQLQQAMRPRRGRYLIEPPPRKSVDWQALTFAAPPSANALTFNKIAGGRTKTPGYRDWLRSAGHEILAQRPGCVMGSYHLTIRVRRATLRRDIDNFCKPVSDLLVKMGCVEDDRLCCGIDIAWTNEGEGVTVKIVSTRAGEAA